MELRQLAHFVAVAEERSFTRAGARLHMVQSGLSASVASLEHDLGVTLFDRTTRRVALTDPGRELLAHAREVLDAAERAEASIALVATGVRGTLRVGIMHALLAPQVAQALAQFHRERPHVTLRPQTSQDGSTGLIRAVRDNDLDLAFAVVAAAQERDVKITPISSEPMVVVCPPRHRLARRRTVGLRELADETFIDVPLGWGSRSSIDQLFRRHGVSRHVDIEVGDVTTVLDLVRVGLGIALIAPSSAPSTTGLVTITPKPAPTFDVSLVLPRHRHITPAAQALTEAIVTLLP